MSTVQQELGLSLAKKRGALAAQACADAADKHDPKWSEAAYKAFVTYVRIWSARQFTTEDVRLAATSVGTPPDARAWGAIAIRVKREGLIKSVGWQPVISSNGSPKTLWQSTNP